MKTLLVDMNNLLFRAFFVSSLHNKSGQKVSGIFGAMKMLKVLLVKFKPDNVVVAWDLGKSQQRIQIYPEYKAHRDEKRKPEDVEALQYNRERTQAILSSLPVKQVMLQDVEADDVIGYLCEKLKGKKIVVSNDQDFFQLVNKDTHVYMPNKQKLIKPSNVENELGFPVKYYVLWKSMVGDTSDNIKGIHGIGPKKATKIIQGRLAGQKKLPINSDEMKILNRNKDLIAIGALLQPDQIKEIRKVYRKEKTKDLNFKAVKVQFAKQDFNTLFFAFQEWIHPFEILHRKSKGK